MLELVTLNPNKVFGSGTLSNGNLTYTGSATVAWAGSWSTLNRTSGKWYWEVKVTLPASTIIAIGVASLTYTGGVLSDQRREYRNDALKGHSTTSAYGATYTTNDVIGTALDMDNGTIEFYKNGVSQGVAFTDVKLLATVYPFVEVYANASVTYNFGATAFSYSVPSGYQPFAGKNINKILISLSDGSIKSINNPPTDITWDNSFKGSTITLDSTSMIATIGASYNDLIRTTSSKSIGKWYWEVKVLSKDGTVVQPAIGIVNDTATSSQFLTANTRSWYSNGTVTTKYNGTNATYGNAFTTGDVIGIALDLDGDSIEFYKNGVSQGVAFTGLTANAYYPMIANATNAGVASLELNLGRKVFSYSIPSGYKAYDEYIPILKSIPSSTELNFINHGMTKTITLDLSTSMTKKQFIEQSPTVLGSGKVFKKSIDTSSLVIKKASVK